MTDNPTQPPAGRYDDPENPGQQRYWDGTAWTAPTSGAPMQQATTSERVEQAPQPPTAGRPNWFRRHWKGLTIGAVALLVGVGIGAAGKKNDTSKQDDQIKAQAAQIQDLTSKNADLQRQVDDRAAQTAADRAHAAAVTADAQAAARAKAKAAAKARQEAAAKAMQQVQAAAAAAAAAEAKKNTIDGDGIYAIGTDVNAGQWRSSGGSGCYYAVLNSPDTTDIATNNLSDGPAIVNLPLGKYFDTTSCGTWTRSG